MTKRDKFILAAFVCSTLLVLWLVERIAYPSTVRDYAPPRSWYILNVAIAGVVLVTMAAVTRVGRWWQRLVAPAVCICPFVYLYDFCRWSLVELSRP
jgi:hypothetical protein